jgi:sulfite reductase (NADPH) hemoprotein beta-component
MITRKPTHNEEIKAAIPTLAGAIATTLANPLLDQFSPDDQQFIKFHGLYQGDDRDARKSGTKHYQFMVRTKIPAGILIADQYLVCDELADRYANGSLRLTSRQDIQFHGILKSGLGPAIKAINDALLTTAGACGDVHRNVMAPPTPSQSPVAEQVIADARRVSSVLLPVTKAYHAIWIEGVQLDLDAPENKNFEDPLYGKTYLPRKFKTNFAIPPLNDVDVLSNDLGFIAIIENDRLVGYNVTIGGGLGMSHNNPATFARLADVIGFVTGDTLTDVTRAVIGIHRDFGDRTNRKHARLKYIVAEKGLAWCREELERRLGFKLGEGRPFQFTRQGDLFGWHRQLDGRWFLGLYIESGRIKSELKKTLRDVIAKFHPEVRLTPTQNLLLVNVADADRSAITKVLGDYANPSALRRSSMACVALPTCGMALAEAERFLPALLDQLETVLAEFGLSNDEITVRITGCPNGCVRSYTAEIGLVGKSPGLYHLFLGGNAGNTRLNRLYKENIKTDDIPALLHPILAQYVQERQPGEAFGDWAARALKFVK